MISCEQAVSILKERGIEAFELSGVLTVPCSSPDDIYNTAEKLRKIFKEIGFDKSWRIDPYYLEHRKTLTGEMYADDLAKNTQPIIADN